MRRFAELSGPASEFSALTFRGLARELTDMVPPYLAVGCWTNAVPMGLALGRRLGRGHAALLSLTVAPTHRRRGVGRALLANWERVAARLGATEASAHFSDDLPAREAFCRLLAASGWPAPTDAFFRVIGHAGVMTREVTSWPVVARRLLPASGVSHESFDLRPEDDAAIERLLAQPEAAGLPDPRSYLGVFVPETSVAIRRRGELVGWIVGIPASPTLLGAAHRPDVVSIEYAVSYVDAALFHTAAALGGYIRAFGTQARVFGEDSLAVYFTHPGRPRMAAMTRRRFGPIAIRMDTVLGSRKALTAG